MRLWILVLSLIILMIATYFVIGGYVYATGDGSDSSFRKAQFISFVFMLLEAALVAWLVPPDWIMGGD